MKTVKLISYFVIAIIGFTSLFFSIKSIIQPKQPDANTADFRQHIVDSVRLAENKLKIETIKAMQAKEVLIAKDANKKVNYYKNEAERLKHISDSLISAHEAELDTICREIITSKQNEIDTLNRVVNELDNEAESYSRNLYLCETKYNLQLITDSINTSEKLRLNTEIYKLQKSNKRNWIERNSLWIGIGSGIVGTLLIKK
jgi:hypothetical protein